MDPVRKLVRLGLMFTGDRSGASPEGVQKDPKLDLLFCRFSFGSVPGRFQKDPLSTPGSVPNGSM